MSELVDIRTALVALLAPIPELVRVEPYERADIGTGSLPAASLFLVSVTQPSWDTEPLPRFGVTDFECEWRVNVRLAAPGPLYEVTAQQIFETLFKRVRDALPTSGQLLADATNTTFISKITNGSLFLPPSAEDSFIAQYQIITITLT